MRNILAVTGPTLGSRRPWHQLHENVRTNNNFIQMLSNNFHMKKCKCFFYVGQNQKIAKKGRLDPTAINLSVSYKRWFGVKPFEVNATVTTYWYHKKMQTNKMLSKAFNFALNIEKHSAGE